MYIVNQVPFFSNITSLLFSFCILLLSDAALTNYFKLYLILSHFSITSIKYTVELKSNLNFFKKITVIHRMVKITK